MTTQVVEFKGKVIRAIGFIDDPRTYVVEDIENEERLFIATDQGGALNLHQDIIYPLTGTVLRYEGLIGILEGCRITELMEYKIDGVMVKHL